MAGRKQKQPLPGEANHRGTAIYDQQPPAGDVPATGDDKRGKNAPPALPALEVPRALTSEVLGKLLNHALVTLAWPAGWGKTTLMARLLAEVELLGRLRTGRPLVPVWYRLDPGDRDPAGLTARLAAAVGGSAPAVTLRETLAAFPGELVVFLDDYHHLDPAGPTAHLLGHLVSPPLPNLRLCIASRRPLPPAPLRLSGLVWELEPGEAAFTLAETRALLTKGYGLELSSGQIALIDRRTAGWVAGLHLVARRLQGRLRAGATVDEELERELSPSVEEYFAGEVLGPMTDGLQEFVLRTGILRVLEPDFVDRYLETSGSRRLLEELTELNAFLSPRAQGHTYHPLFAAFLQRELARRLPAAEVRRLHRRAGDLRAAAGDLEEATHHYRLARAWPALADLCGRVGLDYIHRGRGAVVARCLDALPAGLEDGDPRLLLCRGHLTGTFDQARTLQALERAAALFARRLSFRGRLQALMQLGTAYARQNRLRDLRRVARRLPLLAFLSGDRSLRGALVVWACGRAAAEDRLDRGLWLARLAARLPLVDGLQRVLAAHEATLLCRRGRLEAAERAARRGPAAEDDLALADDRALLGSILDLRGEQEASLKLGDELLQLADRHGSAFHRAWAARGLAHACQRENRLEDAARFFTDSLESFLEAGNQALAAVTRLELALLRVAAGGPAAPAYEEGRRAFSQLRRRPGGPALEDLGLALLGCLAREAGRPREAERLLEASLRSSLRKSAPQAATGTKIQLAGLYLSRGDHDRAGRHLAEAFGRARYHGYLSFAEWHGPTLFRLCLHALERGIEPGQAAALVGKWFPGQVSLQDLPATAPGESRRAIEHLLEEAPSGGEKVHIRLLGCFEVEARGRPVPESAWRTRKVKGVFKHLVLRDGQPVSREHLMELFWPGADPGAAAASLRVALSSLRHALQGGGMSGVVGFSGEAVRFVPSPDVAVDVHRFQEAAQAGLAAARENDAAAVTRLREARDLYRGDLLPEDGDEEWMLLPRQHLRQLREDVLVTLADLLAQQGEMTEAADCCREVLAENPFREDVYLRLMNLYRAQDRASEAIQVYHQCLTQLRAHLGVDPGPSLQTLFSELLG